MRATFLLSTGTRTTSEASIRYKNEAKILEDVSNVNDVYVSDGLPQKKRISHTSIRNFSRMKTY